MLGLDSLKIVLVKLLTQTGQAPRQLSQFCKRANFVGSGSASVQCSFEQHQAVPHFKAPMAVKFIEPVFAEPSDNEEVQSESM